MQNDQPATFWRDDTMFGVCQALAEDFGFNPFWLRMAFALGLLWAPVSVICAYLGVGVVVLVSRLLAPNPRRAVRAGAEAAPVPAAADEQDQYRLPIAA
jgi:phage shock protein C